MPGSSAAAAGQPAYRTAPWPVLRNAIVSYMNAQRPNGVQGFVEMDVTGALEAIARVQKRLRSGVSFHAYMLHCMVQALKRHPTMTAYRRRNEIVFFDDIDVLTPIEKKTPGGDRIPAGHIVRGAQEKSLAAINWELRQAVRSDALPADGPLKMRRRLAEAPRFVRDLASRRLRRDPFLLKNLFGTVILTNVQPPGFANAGAVLGPTIHTLSLAIGTVSDRLKLDAQGAVIKRKVLVLGGAGDHDLIDGMVASRFIADMTEIVEGAAALDESFIEESRQLARGSTP